MTPDIEQLIHDVLHGQASDEERQRLSDWIVADEDNARAFCRVAMDERAIRLNLDRSATRSLDQLSDSPGDSNAGSVLADLAQAEANAHPNATSGPELPTIQYSQSDALTKQQYLDALSYVLGHTFTPKRIATLATAAVLLLGAVLAIVMLTGPGEGEQMVEQVPDEPAPIAEVPSVHPVVATLTAEYEALWDRQPGQGLFAGQRLTLIQGFAEITTKRGAIAIIEAPATIELTDNDNTIRLHAGKLVGICETTASKGFVVRTPHMDITDLGTRFVVNHERESQTTVQVVEGAVELMPRASGQAGITLSEGQAARLDDASLAIERIAFDRDSAMSDWQQLIRTPRLSGDIVHAPDNTQSLKLDETETTQQILFLTERAGVRLSHDLTLVVPDPTRFDSQYQSPTRQIEAGTVVDSYLLHLDPIGSSLDQEITRCVGAVSFHQPILGVIVSGELITASDELLGKPGIDYAPFFSSTRDARGLESEDRISISADRKTLSVDLSVGYGIDQLRVLVQTLPGSGPGD